jgi:hypothetical protein
MATRVAIGPIRLRNQEPGPGYLSSFLSICRDDWSNASGKAWSSDTSPSLMQELRGLVFSVRQNLLKRLPQPNVLTTRRRRLRTHRSLPKSHCFKIWKPAKTATLSPSQCWKIHKLAMTSSHSQGVCRSIHNRRSRVVDTSLNVTSSYQHKYRFDLFGFVGDDRARPAYFGLLDQLENLRRDQSHSSAFGGDNASIFITFSRLSVVESSVADIIAVLGASAFSGRFIAQSAPFRNVKKKG